MGRIRKTSQPMVLDIMLTPFVESFNIDASDTTQQWYYADSNDWLPNRMTSPLILTPELTVFDPDTSQVYTPTFGDVYWYYLNSSGTFTLITNTTESMDEPYVVYSDGHLKVNKNVAWNDAVTLQCECHYIDPRSTSTSYAVRQTVVLTANRDATVLPIIVDILCPQTQFFDMLKDESSQFTFNAIVKQGDRDVTQNHTIKWYALDKATGNEISINSATYEEGINIPVYPCYVSGQNTSSLVLDAMYTEDITIIARVVKDASSTPIALYPSKAMRTLKWKNIPMDILTYSNNAGSIRDDVRNVTLDNIVNIHKERLSDEVKAAHLRFNWKRRSSNIPIGHSSAVLVDEGWGQKLTLNKKKINEYDSQLVYVESYLMGAYEKVTDGGETVVDTIGANTSEVYDRTL